MENNPLKDGLLTENSAGIGTVDGPMVRTRAVELAAIDGREAGQLTKSDWDQARRELTGKTSADLHAQIFDEAPEAERWDPVPGLTGHKVPVAPSEDEDEDGRSDAERLMEEGMSGAQHEQSLESAKAARKAAL